MAEPFSLLAGGLELTSVLIKIQQEHAKNPERAPGMADILKTIPGAAFEMSNRIIAEANKLEKDCMKAKLDPSKTLDELKTDRGYWFQKRRRVLDNFEIRAKAIREEIAVQFDDVVAISNCSESEDLIAAGYGQALEYKRALRKATGDDLPIGTIIKNLRDYAEMIRAELGSQR